MTDTHEEATGVPISAEPSVSAEQPTPTKTTTTDPAAQPTTEHVLYQASLPRPQARNGRVSDSVVKSGSFLLSHVLDYLAKETEALGDLVFDVGYNDTRRPNWTCCNPVRHAPLEQDVMYEGYTYANAPSPINADCSTHREYLWSRLQSSMRYDTWQSLPPLSCKALDLTAAFAAQKTQVQMAVQPGAHLRADGPVDANALTAVLAQENQDLSFWQDAENTSMIFPLARLLWYQVSATRPYAIEGTGVSFGDHTTATIGAATGRKFSHPSFLWGYIRPRDAAVMLRAPPSTVRFQYVNAAGATVNDEVPYSRVHLIQYPDDMWGACDNHKAVALVTAFGATLSPAFVMNEVVDTAAPATAHMSYIPGWGVNNFPTWQDPGGDHDDLFLFVTHGTYLPTRFSNHTDFTPYHVNGAINDPAATDPMTEILQLSDWVGRRSLPYEVAGAALFVAVHTSKLGGCAVLDTTAGGQQNDNEYTSPPFGFTVPQEHAWLIRCAPTPMVQGQYYSGRVRMIWSRACAIAKFYIAVLEYLAARHSICWLNVYCNGMSPAFTQNAGIAQPTPSFRSGLREYALDVDASLNALGLNLGTSDLLQLDTVPVMTQVFSPLSWLTELGMDFWAAYPKRDFTYYIDMGDVAVTELFTAITPQSCMQLDGTKEGIMAWAWLASTAFGYRNGNTSGANALVSGTDITAVRYRYVNSQTYLFIQYPYDADGWRARGVTSSVSRRFNCCAPRPVLPVLQWPCAPELPLSRKMWRNVWIRLSQAANVYSLVRGRGVRNGLPVHGAAWAATAVDLPVPEVFTGSEGNVIDF